MSIKETLKELGTRHLILIFVVPVITAGLLTYILLYSFYFEQYDFHGITYNKNAPDFELYNHLGHKTHLSDLKGEFVLITFGYTNCPDVCPTTLTALDSTISELDGLEKDVNVLFITVDPVRDTKDRLKEYIPFFNNNFIGLTGEPENLEKVAESYSVFSEKVNSDSKAGYFMNHTPAVYLINKQGKLSLIYPYDKIDPKKIARDIIHMNKYPDPSLKASL